MHLAVLVVASIACVAAIAIGGCFLLASRRATIASGVAEDNLRALTEIKGVRDIARGAAARRLGHRRPLGWALIAAPLTPIADAMIVLTNGGELSTALGIHGLTAGLLVERVMERQTAKS